MISAYENGKRDPGFAHMLELVRAAGFTLDLQLQRPVTGKPKGRTSDLWAMVDSSEDDDRITENLRLSPSQRLRKMGSMRGFAAKYRGAAGRPQ